MDGAAIPARSGPDGVARAARQLEFVSDSFIAFRSDHLIQLYSIALFQLISLPDQALALRPEPRSSSQMSTGVSTTAVASKCIAHWSTGSTLYCTTRSTSAGPKFVRSRSVEGKIKVALKCSFPERRRPPKNGMICSN